MEYVTKKLYVTMSNEDTGTSITVANSIMGHDDVFSVYCPVFMFFV